MQEVTDKTKKVRKDQRVTKWTRGSIRKGKTAHSMVTKESAKVGFSLPYWYQLKERKYGFVLKKIDAK